MTSMASEEKKAAIGQALQRIKHQLGPVQLVAVSKYTGLEEITHAYEMGQRDFGENRVQDLLNKNEQLAHLKDLRWHFIGHLQRNKVKDLLKVDRLTAIHSVDSQALLEKIITARLEEAQERRATRVPKDTPGAGCGGKGNWQPLDLFFEVNTSGEEEKSGFRESKLLIQVFQQALKEAGPAQLHPLGLMTMGTFRTDNTESEAHRCFKQLQDLKWEIEQSLGIKDLKLSMGMSSDYQIALQYGADYVRIGSQIFG